MKKWCLAWLSLYLFLAVGFMMWFLFRFPEAPPGWLSPIPPLPVRVAVTAGWGLVCALPAAIGLAGLDGIRTRLSERVQMVAAARGQRPRDGIIQPFVGHIIAKGEPLTAPLSRSECLIYRYEASHSSGGKSSSKVTDAEGYGMAPAAIETPAGIIELRAYLDLEFSPDTIEEALARERLRTHQSEATLYQPCLNLTRNYQESQAYLLDDDGSICYDHGSQGSADQSTRFEEKIVKHGEEIEVFGLYSALRGAVIPDPESEVLHRARLRKGGSRQAASRLMREAFVSGLIGTAFLTGAVWLAHYFFSGLASTFY
jgi:hypothetical protein